MKGVSQLSWVVQLPHWNQGNIFTHIIWLHQHFHLSISPKTFVILTLTGNKTTISHTTYNTAAPPPSFPEYPIPYLLSVDGFHSFRATKMQWVKKTNYLIKPLQWKQEDFCKKTKEWGNPGIEPGTTRNFAVRQRSEASLPGLLPKRVSYP
jgi:hypothetical protein